MPSLPTPSRSTNLSLKNRIVMPPMANDFSSPAGEVNQKRISITTAPAPRPASALVIVEHSYIVPEGKMTTKQLGIHERLPGSRA